MPCNDYPYESRASIEQDREITRLREKNDTLAQHLCWLCGEVEHFTSAKSDCIIDANDKLQDWWEQHKQADSNRIKRELENFEKDKVTATGLAAAHIKKQEKSHPLSHLTKGTILALAAAVVKGRLTAKRQAQQEQEQREAALAKLTAADRKALGL